MSLVHYILLTLVAPLVATGERNLSLGIYKNAKYCVTRVNYNFVFDYATYLVDICGKPAIPPSIGHGFFPNNVVDGAETVPHTWPWQVQLQANFEGYEWRGVCGGTIVTRYHILTAASCFE